MVTKTQSPDPLDPLSIDEILRATYLCKQEKPNARFIFKACTMWEPPKAQLAPYLDAEREGQPLPAKPDRKAEILLAHITEPYNAAEVFVNLSTGSVEQWVEVPADHHAPISVEEMMEAESHLFKSELFKKELAKLKLPKGAVVVADAWIYGSDSFDPVKRMIHYLCYIRDPKTNDPRSNHYALPLPIVPVMETGTYEVTRVDWSYTGSEEDGMTRTFDFEHGTDHLTANEYEPELSGIKRRPLKPLHVTQPDGPSFTVTGRLVEWQDWRFRVGFNYREGLTIHDVSFKGRPLFYRLSFSDMTVPYADPRPPLHRKQAFDLGDVGAGITANSLKLGCDCLGLIHYFDGLRIAHDGTPVTQENVICMHEEDDGLMWKHTNFRNNHAVSARSRVLILQTILTVANYEYIISWRFDQAGAAHLEIRATGILSTQYIDANKTSPYGTVVHPGVLAAHHQHIFSIRVDPMIDGHNNTVVYDDVVALPFESEEDKKINPYGIGFKTKRTYLETEGHGDLDPFKNRVFKIINENKINPNSQKPVAYKIYMPPTATIIAHPESVAFKRADFADHHVFVTKYRDNQLFSPGRFTNQSRGTQGGLRDWIKEKASTKNKDVVLFLNFGLTHIPRVEDFPIMPSESMTLSLKPNDFFNFNPSIDLPVSTQDFNQSTLAGAQHRQGNAEIEEAAARNGFTNGHTNGINGHTNGVNGHANGVNGHTNGVNGTNVCCH